MTMEFIKQIVIYAILIAVLWAAIVFLPGFRRLTVPGGNTEITGAKELEDYPLDLTVTVARLRQGDVVSYRLGDEGDTVVHLAWVAGLPGDRIAVDASGKLSVNDKPFTQVEHLYARGLGAMLPACGPMIVPADHLYLLNSEGQNDSLGRGPLPAIALRGRVGGL